ncbi:MAG: hypothetical protein Q7S33_00840 [Nanoarchaeota archaeon]|nr:hypothetical protein [Nanoarchaeota archaeon]
MPKKKVIKKEKQISKLLYWSPRILSILFILFLSLFSLDIFGNNYTFWETIIGLFMHNIPSFVLIIILLISWKHEWVGAIAFAIGGLLYIFLTLGRNNFEWYFLTWIIQISGVAFLIAYLWFLNWKNKEYQKQARSIL